MSSIHVHTRRPKPLALSACPHCNVCNIVTANAAFHGKGATPPIAV
jgi:hypothetical protein